MAHQPLLQFSLDFISLPRALAVALAVADQVDIIEVGTPLCKSAGMSAVRAVRELFPDKCILADMKTPDVGDLEAQLAFEAGANMVTVMGAAPLETLELALNEARKSAKEVLVELTGVRDLIQRVGDWRRLGVERMVYHRGWDEGLSSREWSHADVDCLRWLCEQGFKISIAGGITRELLPIFRKIPLSIVVAGRAIHRAEDPTKAARVMRQAIAEIWQEG
jgi:3-hexulose-6-phosphate synthase